MPEYVMPGYSRDFAKLDAFVRGYIEAAFFTSAGPDDGDMDGKGFADLAPETLERMKADCAAFVEKNGVQLHAVYGSESGYDDENAGRDFWYTRNGHGVGYWDRGLGPIGDDLAEAARLTGDADMYLGDDGLVYLG